MELKLKYQVLLIAFTFLVISFLTRCGDAEKPISHDEFRAEIEEAERAFQLLTEKEGVPKGFLTYADEDAILVRGKELIKGKVAIAEYFKKNDYSGIILYWSPETVEVSDDGTLGYTVGNYTVAKTDSTGTAHPVDSGIFHTVWKRQKDGGWKFVYD